MAGYREQWVADILGDRSVAQVAVDVHSTSTGALERPPKEQEADIKALQEVVATWRDYTLNPMSNYFDDCVKEMIKAALREARHVEDQKE